MMDQQQKIPPILIYYNMRGQAQAIRGLFCYLETQFVEVHLEKFEEQKKILSISILNKLKNIRIDKSLLPTLIDDQEMICDAYQIMAYLCYKHKQQHLLGSSIKDKARLQQIMEVYVVRQPLSMAEFFRFSEYCATHTEDEIYLEIRKSYTNLMTNSQYIKELCMYVRSRQPEQYILYEISILDFLFLQSCTYMVGVFNNLDKSCREQNGEKINKDAIINGIKYDFLIDLKIMRHFIERMTLEPFYVKNKDFLESFSIITSMINQIKVRGIKKIWNGNPRFIR